MSKVTKYRKRDWHNEMRQRACKISQGICGICKAATDVEHGVIHHQSYPSGVYEVDVEILIDRKICIWICKECHKLVHFTDNIENSGSGKLNAGNCHICGKLCYGGWDRAKKLGTKQCICRRCYKAKKRAGEYVQDTLFPATPLETVKKHKPY